MQTISIMQLREKLQSDQSGYFLIDVRESDEFGDGHIPRSLLMPWHIISEKISGIKQDKHIILYCNTGVRALKAAKTLEDAGFANVSVYPGGWEEWNNS